MAPKRMDDSDLTASESSSRGNRATVRIEPKTEDRQRRRKQNVFWRAKALSDVGGRANNEDALWIDESDNPEEPGNRVRLAIVADGMGGHDRGEEASQIAVEILKSRLQDETWDVTAIQETVREAINEANIQIRRSDAGQPDSRKGMGTTVALAVVSNLTALIAWVGDSRIYRIRNGHLERLTTDHSFVEQLIQSGEITEEDGRTHPHRNRITSALGPFARPPELGMDLVRLDPNDALLLCTDGMWEPLTDIELEEQIVGTTMDEALRRTMAAAIAAGGTDNITGILVAQSPVISRPGLVDRTIGSRRTRKVRQLLGKVRFRLLVALLALALIAIVVGIAFALRPTSTDSTPLAPPPRLQNGFIRRRCTSWGDRSAGTST